MHEYTLTVTSSELFAIWGGLAAELDACCEMLTDAAHEGRVDLLTSRQETLEGLIARFESLIQN